MGIWITAVENMEVSAEVSIFLIPSKHEKLLSNQSKTMIWPAKTQKP